MMYHITVLLLLVTVLFASAQSRKIDSLKNVLHELPLDSNRVNTLIELFDAENTAAPKKKWEYATEALNLAQKVNFHKGEAAAYNLLAYCHYNEGNELEAIELVLKSLAIYQALKNNDRVAGSYNNIGVIYRSQDNLKKALDYFGKAFTLRHESGINNPDHIKTIINISSLHEKNGNDSLAMIYYQQALTLAEKINDTRGLCNALHSMGLMHFKKGLYQQALEYQEEALELALENNSMTMQSAIYNALSDLYTVQHNYKFALEAAERSLDKAVQANLKSNMRDSYIKISEAYKNLNDYKNAYHYQSLYLAVNDSLKSSEKAVAIEKIVNAHEVEKKELEIASMSRVQKIQRNIFIASSAAIIIIGFLFYSRQKLIAEKKLAIKTHRIRFYMQWMKEKAEAMKNIESELKQLKDQRPPTPTEVEKFSKVLQLNIHTDEDWGTFKNAFDEVYPEFFAGLRYYYPDITPSELRLSALIKLKLSIKESAAVLGISLESVKKARYRLRKKLAIPEMENLEEFIQKISSEEPLTAVHTIKSKGDNVD